MESLFNQGSPGFSRFLSVSLIAHIIVIAMVLFLFKNEQARLFITPVYTQVELIAPSPVETPKKVKKRVRKKPKPAPPAKKKTVVKKKSVKKAAVKSTPKKKAVVLKKKTPEELKKIAEEKRIKEEASISDALSRIKEGVKKEQEDVLLAASLQEILKNAEIEERKQARELEALRERIARIEEETDKNDKPLPVITPLTTTATEQVTSELFELEFKAYYSDVGAKIQSLWIYPGNVNEKLETWVNVRINKEGELIKSWIEKSSGDDRFDESAIKAIKKAAPFAPLPEGFEEKYFEAGVRFCPGGCYK